MLAVMGPRAPASRPCCTSPAASTARPAARSSWRARSLGGLSRTALAALRRQAIGYVFQDFNLIPALTAAENVALPLELDGMKLREARGFAEQALDDLEIADLADRMPDDMSGGQRQRVAIARALVGPRRLVLADEPTGALDSGTGEAVLRLLRRRVDAGARGAGDARGPARCLGRPRGLPLRRPGRRAERPPVRPRPRCSRERLGRSAAGGAAQRRPGQGPDGAGRDPDRPAGRGGGRRRDAGADGRHLGARSRCRRPSVRRTRGSASEAGVGHGAAAAGREPSSSGCRATARDRSGRRGGAGALPPGSRLLPVADVEDFADRATMGGVLRAQRTGGRPDGPAGRRACSTCGPGGCRATTTEVVGQRQASSTAASRSAARCAAGQPTPTVVGVIERRPAHAVRRRRRHRGGQARRAAGRREPRHAGWPTCPGGVSWQQVLKLNERGLHVLSRKVVNDPPPDSEVPTEQWYGGRQRQAHAADPGGGAGGRAGRAAGRAGLRRGCAPAAPGAGDDRATGGAPKHIRRFVLAQGVVLGSVAGVVGAGLGVAAGVALRPALSPGRHHRRARSTSPGGTRR